MVMLDALIIGAIFGFVLHRGGLVRYSRIVGMFLLRDFKAMKFMFMGVAVASILYGAADLLNLSLVPRINGYFGVGHLVGGALLGIGMASTGFCPGTCAARFGSGKLLAGLAVIGGFFGVYLYDNFFSLFGSLGGEPQFLTLAMILGVRYGILALALGAMFIGMSFLIDRIDPGKKHDSVYEGKPLLQREWGWLPTGAIAGLMVVLAVARGDYLSFSGAFQAAAAHLASLVGWTMESVPALSEATAFRGTLLLGAIVGALISSYIAKTIQQEKVTPMFQSAFGPNVYLRSGSSFLGGTLIVLGGLTGGGCPTGAFISGWPTLSVGSFAQGMVMFMAAIVTAHLLYIGRWNLVQVVKEKEKLDLAND